MGLLHEADKVRAAECSTTWRAKREVVEARHAAGCCECGEFDESGTERRASSAAGWCFVAVVALIVVALVFVK